MIAYLGGKTRMVKTIVPIIEEMREQGTGMYFEPFVGGGSILESLDPMKGQRYAGDTNKYLIALYTAIQNGWVPPDVVTEEEYAHVKSNRDAYPLEYVAFVGFCCSFASKFFNGYARNKQNSNYANRAKRQILKKGGLIDDVIFRPFAYDEWVIPEGSTVYCDPPYRDTTGYSVGAMDYEAFYDWCVGLANKGCKVLVSEYTMPSDRFECIYSKQQDVGLSRQGDIKDSARTEKLFVVK